MITANTVQLANGQLCPVPAFGTWKLASGDACKETLLNALRCGYRHIDTAAAYLNEPSVGEAISQAIAERIVDRSELFVSGKLWNSKRTYNKARKACAQTIKKLGVDYLDLYLVHWPSSDAYDPNWTETNIEVWKALESLVDDGLVRSIGVCNYHERHLAPILNIARIAPAVNQIELHPGHLERDVLAYNKSQGIQTEAWSPLGNGAVLDNATITEIAAKCGRTSAQICLRWCLQHDALPVTKSSSPERMRQNMDIFSFVIEEKDMLELDALEHIGGSGLKPDQVNDFS